MKRLLIIAAVLFALFLFAGCEMGARPRTESALPVETIRLFTVSDDGKTETEVTALALKGEGEVRKFLRYVITPANALWEAEWTSSDPSKAYYDPATFQVVAIGSGAVTLTATSVGRMANGRRISADCALTVTVQDPTKLTKWTFAENPEGWTPDGYAAQPTDADYGNGMTLLGTSRTMGIYPNRTFGSFSKGAVRIGGNGTVARITGMTGPYSITVNYQSGGTATDDHRYPVIEIGANSFNASHELSTSFGGGGRSLEVDYDGADSDTIVLKVVGGVYIYDVIIERKY